MSERKRILIVGGVAGGASAAARARRLSESAEIVIFERGPFVSFANCGMPYFIGGTIPQRDRLLVQTPESLRKRFRLDVRVKTEVLRIDRQRKEIVVRDLASGKEQAELYDELILSPGAAPVRPPIPGVEIDGVFTLRGMADMDAIKAVIDARKPARALIVGGGYIGLEMAEALRARDVGVTLVEHSPHVFRQIDPEMAAPIHQSLTMHGVDLRLGTSAAGIERKDGGLSVRLSTGESVECGLVMLAIGVRPETRLAREAGLTIGPTGGILVDEHMRTSDPHIFAVGDAVEVAHLVEGAALIPLAGPANRQGRIAADNALGRDSVYRRTQGTAICKVFDLAVGMTGMSEKALHSAGRAYDKVYVHPSSHASYYPGAATIDLKLLFDPTDGRILGAQAVGTDGVDKRIDVLAVAMRAGMTVFDLQELELSYAPPYGSAKDPVNYAGFAAANAIKGDVRLCHAADCTAPADGQVLLDVRTTSEVQAGTIPGAMNVPLDDLRGRLGELPREKELLVFCQMGLRGYLACRILSQNGFRCRNLSGGYRTYQAATAAAPQPKPPAPATGTPQAGRKDTLAGDAKPAPHVQPAGCSCAAPAPAVARQVDACGLQCPGPIMQLRKELETLADGQALSIAATDLAFATDVESFCRSTGNGFLGVKAEGGRYVATVVKSAPKASPKARNEESPMSDKNKTIVVFSSDFDKAMAAFIIANGAAAMGSDVTMFFTFWGLNVLRRPEGAKVSKNVVERMFGWMMPRGAGKLTLSKMNMGGMGLSMIKGIMAKKKVPSLGELIGSARAAGVRLVACAMSMDLMGIKREEMIDGVEMGGVAMYLDHAEAGHVNLFI